MRRAAEEGTIERICLSTTDNDDKSNHSIYMYYDDSAHLKQLPINHRSTEYSRDANDAVTIFADAFVATKSIDGKLNQEQRRIVPFSIGDIKRLEK